MEAPPERTTRWEEYEKLLGREWEELLARPGTAERDFQEFFESHPCCIPQTYRLFQRGAHGPFPGAIITQPPLTGLRAKRPDFLYITRDSATVFAVMVEIEHPSKSWATASEQPSADFREKAAAIARNRYLTQTRKDFLIRRWPYWDSRPGEGMSSSSDVE